MNGFLSETGIRPAVEFTVEMLIELYCHNYTAAELIHARISVAALDGEDEEQKTPWVLSDWTSRRS